MSMATSASASLLLRPVPLAGAARRLAIRCVAASPSLPSPPPLAGRRQCLLFLLSPVPLAAISPAARAADIPLFGIRKRIEKIEEEAEEIVKEGEKAVEGGFVAAEKGIESAEQELAAAAVAGSGVVVAGDLLQAGAVVAAEAVGVIAAVSVVNGILGPEGKRS